MLRVENRYHSEVTISVLAGGQTTRLGMVAAASGASWVFPKHLQARRGEIQLVADPLGTTDRLVSRSIYVPDGAQIVWTLESRLQRSNLAVY